MKHFIITIDTEGDSLWDWKPGDIIHTENAKYLPRFQKTCEEFGFMPTWLSNYEMVSDPLYVEFVTKAVSDGNAELGMHLHAWNTPPEYKLPERNEAASGKSGASYLIEYPTDIMEQKIETMTELIKVNSGVVPTSHRAGRWATDNRYFELLKKYGYIADCSVTPYVDWSDVPGQSDGSKGTDYSKASNVPSLITEGLWEIPVTTLNTHRLFKPEKSSLRNIARMGYRMLKGQTLWLRPKTDNIAEMIWLLEQKAQKLDYVMFMLHSSEMMPGGSPTFKTEESIEKMYRDLMQLFGRAKELGYKGITLSDYSRILSEGK